MIPASCGRSRGASWRSWAFEVIEAEDGEEALEACKRAMPEAILLDWNMPVMDGYEFLGQLRRMPGGDAPKVVFCTTENGIDHISRALAAGANEYIMKPFDRDIVAAKFQEVGLVQATLTEARLNPHRLPLRGPQ